MMWFFGIFTDIFAACGAFLGGIIVFFLALLIVAGFLAVAILAIVTVVAIIHAAWFWFCRLMVAVIPESKSSHDWFKNKWLDMKHPSRVRRRKRAIA